MIVKLLKQSLPNYTTSVFDRSYPLSLEAIFLFRERESANERIGKCVRETERGGNRKREIESVSKRE